MERRNFLKNVKLHKVCAEDDIRPCWAYIHFENGYAYASNGRILCRARVIDICPMVDVTMLENLDGKNLHYKQFESLLKLEEITEITDEAITVKTNGYEVSFKFATNLKYPNAAKIFDNFFSSKHAELGRIALHPSIVKLAGEIMPRCPALVFEFGEHANAPLLIRYPNDYTDKDIKLIISPCCVND